MLRCSLYRAPSALRAFDATVKHKQASVRVLSGLQDHQAVIMPGHIQTYAGNVAAAQLLHCSIAQADFYVPDSASPQTSFPAPFVIGVAGGTASGKTSVCQSIIKSLQEDQLEHQGILSLPQDCFYRNLTDDEQKDIANFNFDHPSAYAFDEIIACVKQLKRGKPVEIPVYDFVTSSRTEHSTRVARADVILFDGILAFHHEELRDLFDLKIFVDTDADTRLARRMRRDMVERGRDVLQVLNQYERTVKPSFESYIYPSKKFADIIVPRGAENAVAIDLILQHIRLKLMMRGRLSSTPSGANMLEAVHSGVDVAGEGGSNGNGSNAGDGSSPNRSTQVAKAAVVPAAMQQG